MGGSNYYKEVANYATLASYYDDLLQDEESLSEWMAYVKEYTKGKDVLELASGSGVMAKLLKAEGYNVIASDISEQMKEVSKTNFDGEYKILNMINFSLDQKFDAILCFCDSMNYLEDYDEMKEMFLNIKKHLKTNGVFIFDMHHEERLNEFAEEYVEEGFVKGTAFQWTIEADSYAKELYERFVFYEEDGIIEEHHLQRVFDYDKTFKLLEECGFKVSGNKDFIKDEKVILIGELND